MGSPPRLYVNLNPILLANSRNLAEASPPHSAPRVHRNLLTRAAYSLTLLHDFLEHLELEGRLEADEVHAALAAEVPPVEPVPVLELVPRLAPRQEVVVVAQLSMGRPCKE